MELILKRARFLELQDYPRDYRDCIKQAMGEFNDTVRDVINQFDITYEEFYENCIKCYNAKKSNAIRKQWH